MSMKSAYADGFRKAAEASNVDPERLVKFAKETGILASIVDAYNNLPDSAKNDINRGIIGGLGTGAATALLSDGTMGTKLKKGLIGAGLGGLGTYGLSRAGVIDKAMSGIDGFVNEYKRNARRRRLLKHLDYRSGGRFNEALDSLADRLGVE